ncbi:hypothetical protein E2C01_021816 [Portunus trituberculatus]|uniref:PiggyBac transposable element-derived protein domain-containing protein n=1 Tax=Portunus trituberculatus TaxID=210409 RepID=A0A5B7E4F0_PORTR|nr:hypothetical protein [Portunus trituberculatus]
MAKCLRLYMVGFESTRGCLPYPMLTTLSTMPPPPLFVGRKWVNVTGDEMYMFAALQLLMGLNPLPIIADYWSQNILHHGPPLFTRPVLSATGMCRYYTSLGFQTLMAFAKEFP